MLENLAYCLNATAPIFLLMLLGLVFRRLGFFSQAFADKLNDFVFKVGLPVMLFKDLVESDFFTVWDGPFVLFCFLATLGSILLTAALSLFCRERPLRGEFIQVGYRSSIALLGAAFLENLYGTAGAASLVIIGAVPLYNVAAVMVTASYPAFARQGQTIDVVVSSMGNAKSLRGGTLLMTPLKGVDSQVYALAQGNILVGGAGASAGGSSVQVNQLNGGRITNGAIIERELPTQFGTGNTINLQLNNEDFTMAQQIADTINRSRGYGSATALDARTVQIRTSTGSSNQVRMLADIQNMEVNVSVQDAKVIINSRTGSVVMNREVTLDSCAVAQGNLSVTVNRSANVSQPDTPFGGGQTVVTPQTQIDLRQSGGSLQSVRSSANLNSVVRALNALGATPMDLMSILQSMQSAGCLRAKLEII